VTDLAAPFIVLRYLLLSRDPTLTTPRSAHGEPAMVTNGKITAIDALLDPERLAKLDLTVPGS
jgi:hypothetical protein